MTNVDAPREAPAKNMVWIPGGEYLMGSEQFYPEERPVRSVSVGGFWMLAGLAWSAQARSPR